MKTKSPQTNQKMRLRIAEICLQKAANGYLIGRNRPILLKNAQSTQKLRKVYNKDATKQIRASQFIINLTKAAAMKGTVIRIKNNYSKKSPFLIEKFLIFLNQIDLNLKRAAKAFMKRKPISLKNLQHGHE